MPGADAVSALLLDELGELLELQAAASIATAAIPATAPMPFNLCDLLMQSFLLLFTGRPAPAQGVEWHGRGGGGGPEQAAQAALDARREDEHDDDQDDPVGGDRDAGAGRPGQPVAGRHVGEVGGDKNQ